MDTISDYFALPKSHRLYSHGLQIYIAHLAASNPRLTAQLTKGPIGNNQLLLDNALEVLRPEYNQAATTLSRNSLRIVPPHTGSGLINESSLVSERRKLLQLRAKTSQQFHDCSSDEDRAEICEQLDSITKEVRKVEGDIEYFRLYGHAPPPPPEEKKVAGKLPTSKNELATLRSQLSSRRWKVEKALIKLLELPNGNPKRSKISDKRAELESIEAQLKIVKNTLKEMRKNGH
ncbi:MAG: hypothetical protein AAFU67_14310 [Bacteroidota bacterium]